MMTTIIAAVVALAVGFFGGKIAFESILKSKKESAEKDIKKAKKEAEEILKKAEYKASKIEERAEKEIEHKEKKLEQTEARLLQKEERMEEKMEKLETKKEEYHEKKKKLEEVLAKEKTILSDLSGLSPEEAKKKLFEQIEADQQEEISRFVNKFKMIKEEESKEEAGKIIAKVLPRLAQEGLNEHLVTMVDLPSEDMKGKIIGREGRNIGAFERVAGVEVTIDDTPMTLKLSGYEPEKRFIAAETMKKLVTDGRINPVHIEKVYNETLKETSDIFTKKGKETLATLNLPMMKPEIVEYIGRFHIRYSYGQNLLLHSIEVAKLAEMLANEL
jgi:ribonuclease Y